MKKAIVQDFTTGKISRQLLAFSLPFIGTNAFQLVYSMVDMIIIGKFVGSGALTAVSQSSNIINFFVMACMGFSTAGQIVISQLLGAEKSERIGTVVGTMFTFIFLLGTLLEVLLLVFHHYFVYGLHVPDQAAGMALTYLSIGGIGILFTCGYNASSAVLRGLGDSFHPFLFIVISSAMNLVLDLLFVGVFQFGVAGAASATVISQAASFAACIAFFVYRRKDLNFRFSVSIFRPDAETLSKLFKTGLPIALQAVSVTISMFLVNRFINPLGVTASDTFSIGMKLDEISNKISLGIQFAAGPMIGQCFAARKHDRVRLIVRWTWAYSAVIAGVFILAYLNLSRPMFSLFTSDEQVFAMVPVFISGIIWLFPGMTLMRGPNALLQGTGNTFLNMLFALIEAGTRILFSILFGFVFNLGFWGFVFGYALAPYGIGIPGTIYYLSGKWVDRKTLA